MRPQLTAIRHATFDPMRAYIDTDERLHLLCQAIAKANRTYVPSREDDSHTNLFFDVLGDRIVGRGIDTPIGSIRLCLRLDDLHFAWLDRFGAMHHSEPAVGRTMPDIEQALAHGLRQWKLDPSGFHDELHFEITEYPFNQERITALPEAGIAAWRGFRRLANAACWSLLGHLRAQGEPRIWPHHFDTGVYVEVPISPGKDEKLGIGFGLAMADPMVREPYAYLSAYPSAGSIAYDRLPALRRGRWETGPHWKGAVLPFGELCVAPVRSSLADSAMQDIGTFVSEALAGLFAQVRTA